MKNFILRTLLFFIILILGLASLSATFSYISDTYALSKDKLVGLNNKILIMGDSHLQCAINPNLIDATINICNSSEEPIITYSKLLYLVEKKNIKPQKILYGLSYHTFSDCGDNKHNNINEHQISRLNKNLYLLDNDTLLKYLDISKFEVQAQGLLHKQNILKNSANYLEYLYQDKIFSFSFLGGFYDSNRNNLSDTSLTNALDIHYGIERNVEISQQKSAILLSMLNWSKQHNIEIVFMNTPLHEKYRNSIPIDFKNKVDSIISNLVKYNGMNYKDYTKYELPDSTYGDYDHLNKNGAEFFTLMIDNMSN